MKRKPQILLRGLMQFTNPASRVRISAICSHKTSCVMKSPGSDI